ncbi:MAG TPA: sugar phosphate isomerase/epimerase [Candidatus Borkfalkia excrementigallinarum]|uniref:Sugar phosphate isomerase/epimerase n=1 Tax=Candidatus Borkfalkia excrementigallinarum TaxID=2838506 RepID=A0A9D1ZWL9_9FIRM|nr:sugar phosphate isomerase/epimerase [Candidatus Borkfalkia excrementigallinarum]
MISGVSTSSLFLRELNEDALTVLNGLGVKSTEIFLTTFSEYSEEFARLLLSRRGGLIVNSVHLLNTQFEPQLFGAHPRAKKDAFEILHRAMASAHIFGAERYTFHGITRLKRNSSPLNYDSLGENFNEIIAACAEHGVRLCLENVHWALYNEPGIFSQLKRRCPALSGVLDVKQARLSGYPYQMYIKDMEGSIAHVHLSDVDGRGKICLPGRGIFDFEECLRRLKDAGFDGALIVEVYPKDYGEYAELKRSCEFLDEIIYKIG